MKYFKNTELAKLYHVSEKSIRNWIQSVQDNKLDLQLHEEKGHFYVANTSKNTVTIERLVEKGKKYKNTRGFKLLQPVPEFYDTYSHKQILDIISNIEIHREVPLQYSYVKHGAESWEAYAERLAGEPNDNILSQTIQLLDKSSSYIDQLLEGHQKINLIDLGPGNGLPARPTIERLLAQNRLGSYIAVDISQDMLDIVERNIKQWFGNKVDLECHIRDLSYERFDDLLYEGANDNKTANLVFIFGGTLNNFRSPDQALQAVNNSLGLNDVLVYSGYLDTPKTRRYFDFHTGTNHSIPVQPRLILDFLNVDESYYEVDQVFDEKNKSRSISIRPNVDWSIEFKLPEGTRRINIHKNEPLLLMRHRHYSALNLIDLFDKNGFDLMQATKSKEQEYLILISKIKTALE